MYKGDEDIRYLDGADTEVSEGDELSIIPPSPEAVPEGDVGSLQTQVSHPYFHFVRSFPTKCRQESHW